MKRQYCHKLQFLKNQPAKYIKYALRAICLFRREHFELRFSQPVFWPWPLCVSEQDTSLSRPVPFCTMRRLDHGLSKALQILMFYDCTYLGH